MPKKYYSKSNSFYPLLIISNIGLIMSISYISNLFVTLCVNALFNLKFHYSQIFGSTQWDFETAYSYSAIFSGVVDSIIMIGVLVCIVDKAKMILDYALTNLIIHVLLIWIIEGFPVLLSFWIANGLKITAIIIIAEYLSLKIERQDIKLHLNFLSGNI